MEAFLTAAGLVFVAELGDKTQLVALSVGARYRLVPVLAGITVAYAATNLLSVVVGGVLGAALPNHCHRPGRRPAVPGVRLAASRARVARPTSQDRPTNGLELVARTQGGTSWAHRVVVQNLVLAGAAIVVLVTLDLLGKLPLPLGVAGHEGSTIVVALNGLRLLGRRAWPIGN